MVAGAQDLTKVDKAISFPDKTFASLNRKTSSIEQKLDKQTDNYLNKLQKQENKLRRKLYRKDSSLAKQLFDGVDEKYAQLKNVNGSVSKFQNVYSGHLDSLSTALNFLKGQSSNNSPELQKTLVHYNELQQKLNASDQIRKQLQQRAQTLKEQFEKLGMVKELKQFRKDVYYYQQQVRQYKQAFEDPSKLEAKLMEMVMKLSQFKDFFAKNSVLGGLFTIPSNYSTSLALVGLQTRSQIQQQLLQRFGTSPINGVSPQQYMQGQVQQAQNQLNKLKDKLNKMGMQSGDGNTELPNFKPNNQKTKTFLERIEYGFNIQNQRGTNLLPVTSDLAATLGYKLNDKSSLGVATSYKLGLGKGIQNIQLSNQGVGLRSFVDYKIKGGFWLAGGFEYNYMQSFKSLNSISNIDLWQKSGLIGISRKINAASNKQANLQLLYDFFALKQIPKSQPLKFRIGYTFHK
jgi:hypothetical protein